MAWNSYPSCFQMWTHKLTNTRTIYVLKLDFIALNDCSWIIVLSSGGKMLKTITFYENYFDTRNSYPNRVWVRWGSPTPLVLFWKQCHILLFALYIQQKSCKYTLYSYMVWVPNLMFLSRTCSFLIFVWLIFNFDIFTHSWGEFHNCTVSLVPSIDWSSRVLNLGVPFSSHEEVIKLLLEGTPNISQQ